MDALRDILAVNGEVLPLVTDDTADLAVFNARAVDALDGGQPLPVTSMA